MDDVESRYHRTPVDGEVSQSTKSGRGLKVRIALISACCLGLLCHIVLRGCFVGTAIPISAGNVDAKDGHVIALDAYFSGNADKKEGREGEQLTDEEGEESQETEESERSEEGSEEGVASQESERSDEGSEEGVTTIARAIKDCTELYLNGAQIDDAGAEALAEILPACQNLQILGLTDNQIGDAGAKALAKVLPACKNLRLLRLSNNQIGNAGAQALAEALPHCGKLWLLGLSKNQIEDPGAYWLLLKLPSCKRLQDVFLNENKISKRGVQTLNKLLASCKRAAMVYLGGNLQDEADARRASNLLVPRKDSVELLHKVSVNNPEDNRIAGLIEESRVLSLAAFHEDCLVNCTRKNGMKLSLLATSDLCTFCGFIVTEFDRHEMTIVRLAVRAEFRRHGLGKVLLQGVVKSAMKRGDIKKVTLCSVSPAVKFYKSLGFRAHSYPGELDREGVAPGQIRMAKMLQAPRKY